MKRERRTKSSRVVGDSIWYFCFHNLISVMLFFFFTVGFDLYGEKNSSIAYFISTGFWVLCFQIFAISLVSGIIGRLVAFVTLRAFYKYKNKSMKRFGEINTGLNKIGLTFLISTFLTALVYSLGIIAILQNRLFDENTLLTLIASYLLVKLGIFFIVRLFTEVKL